ncbi:MAG: hypothetical protein GY798_18535 [Hyphomicrobiales bacterium]|nr:hypothetical protein [Hyphomicrobiales bacterium]
MTLAFILLTPPIITVFNAPILVFGIPLLHIYCFGVWLAAIIAGGFLAARNPDADTGRRTEKTFRRG